MQSWSAIAAVGISFASVILIPCIVGIVALVRSIDGLKRAVEGLREVVEEQRDEHKELRRDHAAVADRVTRLEASGQPHRA